MDDNGLGMYARTDSGFRQRFWRQAFVYANILEKDEINQEEIDAYVELRNSIHDWMKHTIMYDEERIMYLKFNREHPVYASILMIRWTKFFSYIADVLAVMYLGPVSIVLSVLIINLALDPLNESGFKLLSLPKFYPMLSKFISWFVTLDWGIGKCILTPFFVQANIFVALCE